MYFSKSGLLALSRMEDKVWHIKFSVDRNNMVRYAARHYLDDSFKVVTPPEHFMLSTSPASFGENDVHKISIDIEV